MAKRYWLVKSEPGAYSIDDLERDGRTHWDSIRSYPARNIMRDEMRVGDEVLFYHSQAGPPAVAGRARVVRTGYPDHTARDPAHKYYDPKATEEDPRWYMVDVEFAEKFERPVPLPVIKETPGLEDMVLVKRSRLSVQPVKPEEFEIVLRLARASA